MTWLDSEGWAARLAADPQAHVPAHTQILLDELASARAENLRLMALLDELATARAEVQRLRVQLQTSERRATC